MPPDGGDLELIARANRGDTAAFEELYERYREWVLRLAVRRLGDIDEGLDVLQDTFLALFARFPGFELTAAMTTFLYPVVENLCRRRRIRRRRTVDFDEDATPALSPADQHDTAADAASLLASVTPEQRELLILRFADDLSLPQLAATLGVPVGTIKSRLHYAIVALRRKVDPLRSGES